MVVATVADYERMKKIVEKNNTSPERLMSISKKIAAIDNAIIAVCDGEDIEAGRALMRDIAYRRGYSRSEAKKYYPASATFERRKHDLVSMIGKMLGVI